MLCNRARIGALFLPMRRLEQKAFRCPGDAGRPPLVDRQHHPTCSRRARPTSACAATAAAERISAPWDYAPRHQATRPAQSVVATVAPEETCSRPRRGAACCRGPGSDQDQVRGSAGIQPATGISEGGVGVHGREREGFWGRGMVGSFQENSPEEGGRLDLRIGRGVVPGRAVRAPSSHALAVGAQGRAWPGPSRASCSRQGRARRSPRRPPSGGTPASSSQQPAP